MSLNEEDTLKVAFGCLLLGFMAGLAVYPWITPPRSEVTPPFPNPSAAANAWRLTHGIRGYAMACPQTFNGEPCTLSFERYDKGVHQVTLLCTNEGCSEL